MSEPFPNMSLISHGRPYCGVWPLHQDVVCEFFSGTTKSVIPLLSDQLLDCKRFSGPDNHGFYVEAKDLFSIKRVSGVLKRWQASQGSLVPLETSTWDSCFLKGGRRVWHGMEQYIYIYIYIYSIYIPPKKAQIGRFPESSDHILFECLNCCFNLSFLLVIQTLFHRRKQQNEHRTWFSILSCLPAPMAVFFHFFSL